MSAMKLTEELVKQIFFATKTLDPNAIQAELYMVDIVEFANNVATFVLKEKKPTEVGE